MSGRAITLCAWMMLCVSASALAQQPPPDIPLVPGLTFVHAVHAPAAAERGIAQGDYESVVTVTNVNADGIRVSFSTEGASDKQGNPVNLKIERQIPRADLASSRLQVLGFHTDDPLLIPGTTSLGPSLAIMRDLRTVGRAEYAVISIYAVAIRQGVPRASGTLTRASATPVPFPVLINGRRVTLPAIHVTGQLKTPNGLFPWEQYLLDDPQHPVTLRWAFGRFGENLPFTARESRDVVRIDFPAADDRAIETGLSTECRVEMPGIYFDFDRATLKPESNRALTTIATLMRRQTQWRLGVEGHTDNVGTDAYNQDLSTRRAAAVRAALVRDFAIASERLTSAGFGARRPVETNTTIAGRARNRRVELVRDCAAKR